MTIQPAFLAKLPPQGRRIITFCPVCDRTDITMDARVIEENDHTHLLHLQCHHCRHSLVSLVLTDERMVSAMAVLTDCTAADVERFRTAPPLKADDVIDLDAALESEGLGPILDAGYPDRVI